MLRVHVLFCIPYLGTKRLEDSRPISTAHGNLLTIDHDDDGLAIEFGAHFFHEVEIDDEGAVNAEKYLRIKPRFQVRHGFAQEVSLRAGGEPDVILFGPHPADVGDGKKQDAPARFEHNPRGGIGVTWLGTGDGSATRFCTLANALNG